MMQPNFDDVIDYVKAGEDDLDMGKMLDLHPDGQEAFLPIQDRRDGPGIDVEPVSLRDAVQSDPGLASRY